MYEKVFILGFMCALLVVVVISTLFGGKIVEGVSCSFTTADAPNGHCYIETPSLLENLIK